MVFNLKRPDMLSMGQRSPLPLSWMTLKSSLSCWNHLFTFMSSLYKWLQFLPHNKNPFFFHRDSLTFCFQTSNSYICVSPYLLPCYVSKGFVSPSKADSTSFILNHEPFPPSQRSYTFCYLFVSLYIQHTFSTWFFPMTAKCLPMAIFFFKESRTQTSLDFTNPSSYHCSYFFSH